MSYTRPLNRKTRTHINTTHTHIKTPSHTVTQHTGENDPQNLKHRIQCHIHMHGTVKTRTHGDTHTRAVTHTHIHTYTPSSPHWWPHLPKWEPIVDLNPTLQACRCAALTSTKITPTPLHRVQTPTVITRPPNQCTHLQNDDPTPHL